MNNLCYLASVVVVVLASMVFVGCGIDEQSRQLENSILSVSMPKGWRSVSSPIPESILGMGSSIKGDTVIVTLDFGSERGLKDRDLFEIIKRAKQPKFNIDSERIQKVAGRDALRLEMTQTDDEGNVERSIVVTIPLDDSIVTIRSKGSPDAMDAVKDQFDEITDSIKLK